MRPAGNILPETWWLLADDTLEFAHKLTQQQFVSLLKHSCLFEEELWFPDSFVINNFNLRRAFRDDLVRMLYEDRTLGVMCRARNGVLQPLEETWRGFVKDRPLWFPEHEFADHTAFEFLEGSGGSSDNNLWGFELSLAANTFTEGIREVLCSELDQWPNKSIVRATHEAIHSEFERCDHQKPKHTLLRGFFSDEQQPKPHRLTWILREHGFSENEVTRLQSVIMANVNAVYSTVIPDQHGLAPHYSATQSDAFRRRRQLDQLSREYIGPAVEMHSPLSLTKYVRALDKLDYDTLHCLRESQEHERYLKAIHSFSNIRSDNFDVVRDELVAAYEDYRTRIDIALIACNPTALTLGDSERFELDTHVISSFRGDYGTEVRVTAKELATETAELFLDQAPVVGGFVRFFGFFVRMFLRTRHKDPQSIARRESRDDALRATGAIALADEKFRNLEHEQPVGTIQFSKHVSTGFTGTLVGVNPFGKSSLS